jgi:hypothetical protein
VGVGGFNTEVTEGAESLVAIAGWRFFGSSVTAIYFGGRGGSCQGERVTDEEDGSVGRRQADGFYDGAVAVVGVEEVEGGIGLQPE